jgi:hypothetical protein
MSQSEERLSLYPKTKLGWNNLAAFKRELNLYAASKSATVVESINQSTDFVPPNQPGPNATPQQQKEYDREDRSYNLYVEHRSAVCAVLYSCLEPDLQNRVDNDQQATRLKEQGKVGSLWGFINIVITGAGFNQAMSYMTSLHTFKSSSADSMQADYTKFCDTIIAIESLYPNPADKERLWNDLKSHRFVTAMYEISEFKDFIRSNVLTQQQ